MCEHSNRSWASPRLWAGGPVRRRKHAQGKQKQIFFRIQADRPQTTLESATGQWGRSHWLEGLGESVVSERGQIGAG